MSRSSRNAVYCPPASFNRGITLDDDAWSSGAVAFTFAGWFFTDTVRYRAGYWGNWDGVVGNGHMLIRENTGATTVGFFVRAHATSSISVTSTATLSANTWHHIAMSYDSSGTPTIAGYIDGAKVSNTGTGGTLASPPTALRLGGYNATQANLDAHVRDIAIWDGVALPDTTINSLAAGMNPIFAHPTEYWPLDGGTDAVSERGLLKGRGVTFTGGSDPVVIDQDADPWHLSPPIAPVYVPGVAAAPVVPARRVAVMF